jgi:hypothetical protein
MGLNKLDQIITAEEKKIAGYTQKSKKKIIEAREDTAKKLRLSQVLKVLPYDTINHKIYEDGAYPGIEIDGKNIQEANTFEYGQLITLYFSNYIITMEPTKIEVCIHGTSEDKIFTSHNSIKEAYKRMAYKIEKAAQSFKEKREKEIIEMNKARENDLPF